MHVHPTSEFKHDTNVEYECSVFPTYCYNSERIEGTFEPILRSPHGSLRRFM